MLVCICSTLHYLLDGRAVRYIMEIKLNFNEKFNNGEKALSHESHYQNIEYKVYQKSTWTFTHICAQ